MKNRKMSNIKLLFATLFLTIPAFSYTFNQNKEINQVAAWSGLQVSTEANYFNSVTNETGETLRSKLKSIISSPISVSYDWPRYEAADETEGQTSNVTLIYSRVSVAKDTHGGGQTNWNREHSYPQSKIGGSTSAPAKDNHHIFAADIKVNSIRGNNLFGEVATTSNNKVVDMFGDITDNYTNGTYFYPTAAARGEVARATMYLNTLYDFSVTGNFTSTELMLKWHLENPVTNREIYRNNTVYTLQKNRNPYIDHQDWACKVYSGTNAATQALCNAAEDPVDPTSISVTPNGGTVNIGSSLALSATVNPTGANQSVSWSSSNNAIATVNNGVVSPLNVGQTTITVRSNVDTNIYKNVEITVTNIPVAVSGISLDKDVVSLGIGTSSKINALVSPSNASNKSITWQSSNMNVATVNNIGLVETLSLGSTTITATTVDGEFSDTVIINVVENSEPVFEERYTFDNSGNLNWPSSVGLEAYFGTGFGINTASSGGSVTSNNIVSDLALGSVFTLKIAAVTNSPSNTAEMTVYGLDSSNNRITGVLASARTLANDSANLTTQQTFARAKTISITLPTSFTKKINGFELNFASSASRTLLVDIDVYYTLGTPSNQAEAYAGFVNLDEGLGAKAQCGERLAILNDEFDLLSGSAKTLFSTNTDAIYITAQTRIAYMESWLQTNNGVGRKTSYSQAENNIVNVTLIGFLALSCLGGYYFINRRKNSA